MLKTTKVIICTLLALVLLTTSAYARNDRTRVYILLGGIVSSDAYATSTGLLVLNSQLKRIPNVTTKVYVWGSYLQALRDIRRHQASKIALVGYSGGGTRATFLVNTVTRPRPRVDLLVTMDASPPWQMLPLHENVIRAVDYHNTMPLFFGLGGGKLVGPQVITRDVAEQHLAIQWDPTIRKGIVDEVKRLARHQ